MIKIFQIILTNAEIDLINSSPLGHTAVERQIHKMDLSMGRQLTTEMLYSFEHTMTVDTDDLEEAFRLTNLWNDESSITRVSERQASTSVGDMLVTSNGDTYICANFGFQLVDMNELTVQAEAA
mgnify:FL=1|jgi:hypothetical protein|tara:strand:- start:1405 stop:1776 length:372 start_codon:yes stop_codon:yes gene_type:complete